MSVAERHSHRGRKAAALVTGLLATKTQGSEPDRTVRMRYAATRLATVGDQVLVSLANFVLTLAIGRSFSAEALASYGIGLSIGLMVQAVQRHALIIPLMLQPGTRVMRRRGGIVGAHLIVLGCVLLLGAAGLIAAWQLIASQYAYLIVAAAAVCLIVYVQLEFARAILIKLDKPFWLFAHGTWYAGVCATLAGGAVTHSVSYEVLLLALGCAMLMSALAVSFAARPIPFRLSLRLLGSDVSRYGGWAAVATATYAGYNHLPLLLLGALAAPVHAAAFVATRSLMQPLQILLRGLDLADKTTFSNNASDPYARPALLFTFRLAGVYAIAAGAFGAGAAIFAEQLLHLAYGGKFAGFGPALVAWTPVFALMSMTLPFESLVYARKDFRDYYLMRGAGSVAAIVLTTLLVSTYFEVGAIVACGAGALFAVSGTVILLARGTRP